MVLRRSLYRGCGYALVAACGSCLPLAPSALAQGWVIEKVAHSVEPAPDAQGPLNVLMLQGASGSGDVCFNAATLPTGGGPTRQIVYLYRNGQYTTVGRQNDQAPGLPANTLITSMNARPTADGRALLLSGLGGPNVSAANDTAAWLGAGAGLQLIAREGDPAPGIPGVNIATPATWAAAADDASFILRSTLAGASIEGANDTVLFTHNAGITQPLLREGGPMPASLPGVVTLLGNGPLVANGGVALFTVYGSQTLPALVHGTPGNLQVVARGGVPLPGLAAGQVVNDASMRQALARNGRVAFTAGVGGPGGTFQAAWVGTPGDLALVMRTGVAAPGLPAGYTISEIAPANYPPGIYIGAGGHAVILCGVRNGTGPFELALYRVTSAGTPELVAYSGTTAGGETIGSIRSVSVQVDAEGNIAFVAGDVGYTIFTWSARSGLQRIVGYQDVLSIGMSAPRTLLNLSMQSAESIGNGRHPVITDDGRVAFHAYFTDSTTGIFLARIPGTCNDIDFNNDGLFPDTQDIADLLAAFGGAACPTAACDSIDFNNDTLVPDTEDIAGFLRVFAGGTCS